MIARPLNYASSAIGNGEDLKAEPECDSEDGPHKAIVCFGRIVLQNSAVFYDGLSFFLSVCRALR